jgi:hypothetical protein
MEHSCDWLCCPNGVELKQKVSCKNLDQDRYLIFQHLSSPVDARLKEFYSIEVHMVPNLKTLIYTCDPCLLWWMCSWKNCMKSHVF